MRFASVAEVKDRLSEYLARARKRNEPIVVTRHGKPFALIQPLGERDLEDLEWGNLARQQLAKAWKGEEDARSTTTYRRGQVVVVSVRFADQGGAKPRPALVVSTEVRATSSHL